MVVMNLDEIVVLSCETINRDFLNYKLQVYTAFTRSFVMGKESVEPVEQLDTGYTIRV
jgi:hypothetical protein